MLQLENGVRLLQHGIPGDLAYNINLSHLRMHNLVQLLAAASIAHAVVQCGWRDVGSALSTGPGCTRPPNWPVRWDMASSTYMYCFRSCQLDWLSNNTKLGLWGGVVGVDHYWTNQGMPCIDGIPQEFAMQDAFANATKQTFPGARVLQYRITSAVPYDKIVHDKIVSDPDFFVKWNNGTVCQMWYEEHGTENQNCSWPIKASAYDWTNPAVLAWYIPTIIAPTLVHGAGVWLDGSGPDNGAYGCSGQWDASSLPTPYPALNPAQVGAYCQAEEAAQAAVQSWILDNGGMDYNCFAFQSDAANLPVPTDSPAQCAAKLTSLDHMQTSAGTVVLYGSRTDSSLYNDTWAREAVAVFLLTRAEYWWFGFPNYSQDTPNATTAALMLSDYGAPLGNMTKSAPLVFTRAYERANVTLDCSTFTATIQVRADA